MRIGRQVQHSDKIDLTSISAIFSTDKVYRYTLSMKYKEEQSRNKTLAIILKNPSSADEKKADNTIRRVEEYVYANFTDVANLHILNIFAIRATDAKDVAKECKINGLHSVVGKDNNEHITNIICQSDYIITAWGGNSGINKRCYDERIMQVFTILKENITENKKIYRVNTDKGSKMYPFHACFWSNKFNKSEVK